MLCIFLTLCRFSSPSLFALLARLTLIAATKWIKWGTRERNKNAEFQNTVMRFLLSDLQFFGIWLKLWHLPYSRPLGQEVSDTGVLLAPWKAGWKVRWGHYSVCAWGLGRFCTCAGVLDVCVSGRFYLIWYPSEQAQLVCSVTGYPGYPWKTWMVSWTYLIKQGGTDATNQPRVSYLQLTVQMLSAQQKVRGTCRCGGNQPTPPFPPQENKGDPLDWKKWIFL